MPLTHGTRGDRRWLGAILVLALALRLAGAWRPSLIPPGDEVSEYLEAAHRLVFGNGLIPWEYRHGMRSWSMALLVAAPMRLGSAIAPDGMGYLFAVRMAMAAIGLLPVWGAWTLGRALSRGHAIVAALAIATWWELVWFAGHPLTEPVATAAIVAGAACLVRRASGDAKPYWHLVAGGALVAAGVVMRFHYAPAAGVIALALLWGRLRAAWTAAIAGAAATALVSAAIDLWAGQAPFGWVAINVALNLGGGRAAQFGVSPADSYFRDWIGLWRWAAVPVLAFAIVGTRRYPALAAAALINLGVHMAIGHKEYRFVLLTTTLLLLLAALGSVDVATRFMRTRRQAAAAAALLWVAASALLAWTDPLVTRWRWFDQALTTTHAIGADRASCGVLVWRWRLWLSSYAYLHRDVPLYAYDPDSRVTPPPSSDRIARGVNRIVTPLRARLAMPTGFRRAACHDGRDEMSGDPTGPATGPVCVYERAGTCDPMVLAPWRAQAMLIGNDT